MVIELQKTGDLVSMKLRLQSVRNSKRRLSLCCFKKKKKKKMNTYADDEHKYFIVKAGQTQPTMLLFSSTLVVTSLTK